MGEGGSFLSSSWKLGPSACPSLCFPHLPSFLSPPAECCLFLLPTSPSFLLLALPSHLLPGDLSNQKHTSVPPSFKSMGGSPLDKFKLSGMSFIACHWNLGSASSSFPPEHSSSSKLLRILHAHSKISHLLALAALLAEMASSAHLACKAQLRCLITHPSFTTRVELVQILSLHLAHCIFMLNFLLLPQWVSYLRTGVCLVCLSISLAYSTEPGTGWVLNQYPAPFLCSLALQPHPGHSV